MQVFRLDHLANLRQAPLSSTVALSACLVLTACGGGGGSADVSITGLAAVGAGLPNASVTARCVSGPEITGTTDGAGSYTLTLSPDNTSPCMLKVVSTAPAITLFSFAESAGRVNITPATDLIVSRALGSASPQTTFDSFNATAGTQISGQLTSARTYVNQQLEDITGDTLSKDPLTGEFAIGDADDQVLDRLGDALERDGKGQDDLRATAAEGGDLVDTVSAFVGKPAGVTATADSASQITLQWTAVPHATGYHVFRSTSSDVALTVENRITSSPVATAGNYADTGLSASTAYHYRVQALDSQRAAVSEGSAEVTATTSASSTGGDTGGGGGGNTGGDTGGGTGGDTSTSFFGISKAASAVAFLNGQTFEGTNCSVSFANGTMTVTNTATNRTASASFSGDTLDRISSNAGLEQIELKVVDGNVTNINGTDYHATGTPSAIGRFMFSNYVSGTPLAQDAYVNANDGAGNITGASCNNMSKSISGWTRPTLSQGNLDILPPYSTDTFRTLNSTDVAKMAGTYSGTASTGYYRKVQLKPSISTLENLQRTSCAMTVDDQGNATLTINGNRSTSFNLKTLSVMFFGGLQHTLDTATKTTEYVHGYQINLNQTGSGTLTWEDSSVRQGPGDISDYRVTQSDGSYREEYTCSFK